jgi:TetR/AcrR family fatty acid metabolism transcriptional regulator
VGHSERAHARARRHLGADSAAEQRVLAGHDLRTVTRGNKSRHARDYARRTTDRRRDLVRAAIRVFARKGFHAARVGDIAEEAGVAHGLLYHYFSSKEDVLETIFRETWTHVVVEATALEASGKPLMEQLRGFASFFLGTYTNSPSLARVMIREVARSPHVGERVGVLRDALAAIRRMIEAAQARGEVRAGVDPQLATWSFYGALEEILGGWVLGELPGADADVERAVSTVVDVFTVGFAP